MAALQYVDTPGYAALILRRTFADLALPDAIMARAEQWLRDTDAKWHDDTKTWTFPSGATLTFGYLEQEKHKFRYKGPSFQFIAFDELTQFTESQYTYLFTRLRRLKGSSVPVRMRSATNPGDSGHAWVKQRFIIEGRAKGRVFIPAKLQDNPFLDQEEYIGSLSEVDPLTRKQMLDGDWDAAAAGTEFDRAWFKIISPAKVPPIVRMIRYWDLAGSKPTERKKNPDWTAGLKMGRGNDGNFYIFDVVRARDTPGEIEKLVHKTAVADKISTRVYIEQDPGQAGKAQILRYTSKVLAGFTAEGVRPVGTKPDRARPVAAAAERGEVFIVQGSNSVWITDFLDELEMFTSDGSHSFDDQVDVLSGAFNKLIRGKSSKYRRGSSLSRVLNAA